MDVAAVREALHKEPFEPFSMALADGRSIPVPHPDFVAVHPRRIIVIRDDGSWSVVEPILIASLDYAKPREKGDKGGNGSHKRKPKP
jgi:hypothetical protein